MHFCIKFVPSGMSFYKFTIELSIFSGSISHLRPVMRLAPRLLWQPQFSSTVYMRIDLHAKYYDLIAAVLKNIRFHRLNEISPKLDLFMYLLVTTEECQQTCTACLLAATTMHGIRVSGDMHCMPVRSNYTAGDQSLRRHALHAC